MKSTLLSFALLAASSAMAADLTGKWQVVLSVGGQDREQACTFTQKDAELTGNCSTDAGPVQIAGKVEDKKVMWSYKGDYQGTPLTVAFQGSIESATKITGAVSVAEFG